MPNQPGPAPGRVLHLDPDVREALGNRDIAGLYRALQRAGVSQRVIAAKTGQSQSEISEILSGRRVQSLAVLQRIVDGLGIPRHTIGITDAPTSTEPVPVPTIIVHRVAPAAATPARAVMIPIGPVGHGTQATGTRHVDVALWTAREVWALRHALRHTTREFGNLLGVSTKLIGKWEAGAVPGPFHQSLLDTALGRVEATIQTRFAHLATEDIGPGVDRP